MIKHSDCPSYDGVPEYGGPCWTCQGIPEHCPLFHMEKEKSDQEAAEENCAVEC